MLDTELCPVILAQAKLEDRCASWDKADLYYHEAAKAAVDVRQLVNVSC